MPVRARFQRDLRREGGTLHLVTEAPEHAFSCFFCAAKQRFERKGAFALQHPLPRPRRPGFSASFCLSVALTTLFFPIPSIRLSTFQFTKKHESSGGREHHNNFCSFCTCHRDRLRAGWTGRGAGSGDLCFPSWEACRSVLAFRFHVSTGQTPFSPKTHGK